MFRLFSTHFAHHHSIRELLFEQTRRGITFYVQYFCSSRVIMRECFGHLAPWQMRELCLQISAHNLSVF